MNTIFITSGGSVFQQLDKGCQQGGCHNPATIVIKLEWQGPSSYVCDEHKEEYITWYLRHLPASLKHPTIEKE